MKSPYYARTWKANFKLNITDPCYDNTVFALENKVEFLGAAITFAT